MPLVNYAVVMAGGKSSRMRREKCILEFEGRRLVDIAVESVEGILDYYVAISSNAPETAEYVKGKYPWIETPGRGYVEDIRFLMGILNAPFLTVACDIPFVRKEHIVEILKFFHGKSVAGMYSGSFVGINIVAENGEETHEFKDPLIAVNINTPEDFEGLKRMESKF